ncbi:MAG TPA: hypothetical protein VF680_17305 [Allosphingosinicella sp.]
MTLQPKKDMKGQPVLTDTGQPVNECFIALAIRKDDKDLPAFYALYVAQAKLSFPHLLDASGNISHPRFAWKVQDGDGTDDSGQSVAGKPGFAGHYIFKMATRYAPRCFHLGKYDISQVIQNPDEVIRKGCYIRVSGTIDGNGVDPSNRQAVPGLFVSPNLVEMMPWAYDEIVSGPDASKVFGSAPVPQAPPGVVVTAGPLLTGTGAPPVPAGIITQQPPVGLPPAGLPGLAPPAVAAAPAGLPGLTPPGAGLGPPPAAAGPQFIMQPSAQGSTREALHGLGWTDDALIGAGHMIRVG